MPVVAEQISRYTAQVSGYGAVDKATASTERLAKAQAKAKSNFVFKATGGGAAGNQSIISKVADNAASGGKAAGFSKIGEFASGALEGAASAATSLVGSVGGAVGSVTGMIQGFVGVIGGVGSALLALVPGVGPALAVVGTFFTSMVQGVVGAIGSAIGAITGFIEKVIGFVANLAGQVVKYAGVIGGALVGAFATFAAQSIGAAAEMEALKSGLIAVAGSAAEAEIQLKRLAIVAKLPGLGFKEAIEGSIRLQAAGFSARLAEAALVAFGNALATVGKGKAELDGVTTALSQIASKGKISAEEINQLAERIPQIRKAMQAAFGTSDTEALDKMGISAQEFVAKVTQALLNVGKAAGGTKDAYSNLGDVWMQLKATAGQVFNDFLLPILTKVSEWGEKLVASGIVEQIAQGFTSMFSGIDAAGITGFLTNVVAVIQNIPTIIVSLGEVIKSVVSNAVAWVKGLIGQLGAWLSKIGNSEFFKGRRKDSVLGRIGEGAKGLGSSMESISGKDNGTPKQALKDAMSSAADAGNPSVISKAWDNVKGKFSDSKSDIEKKMAGAAGAKTDPLEEARKGAAAEVAMAQSGTGTGDSILGEIAANTATTAKNTNPDLKRTGLGGNDLGRIVSPAELSGIRSQAKGNQSITINASDEDLKRFLQKNFFQLIGQMSTDGYHMVRSH